MRVLCLTPIDHIAGVRDKLETCGEVFTTYSEMLVAFSKEAAIRCAGQCDAIFVNPNSLPFFVDSPLLQSMRVVCTASTGTDHIDMDYCKRHGVVVLTARSHPEVIASVTSTAEHAFGLLLALVRHIPQASLAGAKGIWDYQPYIGRQLSGLKAGVVGYGRLGKLFAKYCDAFGMQVYVYDPYEKAYPFYAVSIGELARAVDVMSLHVHLDDDTRGMINQRLLNAMWGTYLVNTSRGGIVVEKDVVEALKTGCLAGYATDVLADEPGDVKGSPILSAKQDNILVTPHIGGMTREAQSTVYNHMAKELVKWNELN